MPTLAQRHLEQQIADLDQQITHFKIRIGQQVIHLNELVDHPQEAKKGRSTLDRWLGELSLLRRHRLNLYQQLAFAGGIRSKVS